MNFNQFFVPQARVTLMNAKRWRVKKCTIPIGTLRGVNLVRCGSYLCANGLRQIIEN